MKKIVAIPRTTETATSTTTIAPIDPYLIDNQILTTSEEIGRGSYSIVWKTCLYNKPVALKEINVSKDITLAENEKEIMKRLTQAQVSYVVQLLGYSLHGNSYFIAMEYMEHGSLGDFIQENQPLDWSLRYLWIQEITKGLSFLHDYLIVHRDIKGTNILLDKDMHAKIGDFGSSEIMEKDKFLTQIIGTPQWMAPEIIRNEPYNEKIDIYSLAVTILEIVNWDQPEATSDNVFAIMRKAAEGIRPKIDKNCKPKLAKLITWGWHNRPEQRPSAKELLSELDSGVDVISEKISKIDF